MAVMETPQPEAFESKPLLTSDKMAVEIVQGNVNSLEAAPALKSIDFSSENFTSAEVNSSSLFATNLVTDYSASETSSLPLPTTSSDFTTTTSAPTTQEVHHASLLVSEAPESNPALPIKSTSEIVISSALDDTAATSTVPPVVEAQESDLRDTTSLLALPTEVQVEPRQTLPAELQVKPLQTLSETEPDLPIHTMDGALDTPDAQNVALSSGNMDMDMNNLSSFDAPSAGPAPAQDQQAAVHQDAEMIDAPERAQFTKVSREREEDIEDEPSAKRAKTEEDTTLAKEEVTKAENDTAMADISAQEIHAEPEVPSASEGPALPQMPSSVVPVAAQDEEAATIISENDAPITPFQTNELLKAVKAQARTKNGTNFKAPVAEMWPIIAEGYLARVSHPVDLGSMETKLRDRKYSTLSEFKTEVNLIYGNTLTFNGEIHDVTVAGKHIRDAIMKKLDSLTAEPVQKAAKKQRKSTPLAEPAPKAPAPRRQSKSGGAAPAASAAPTFALDPNTSTPLIRRDSTKLEGGRPKREIHPPKHKDLIYSNPSRPKNKKIALELKFCERVLAEMKKPEHAAFADAFKVPVDPVSLNIPSYFNVIKHPMDLSKIEGSVKSGLYSAKDFERDMKLMFANCYKFNPAGNLVHDWGKQLESVFNDVWATKSKWLANQAPTEDPSSNDGSDDEESEEEAELEDPGTNSAIAALSERLTEEQEKMITLLTNPKKNAHMIEMQNDMVQMLKDKLAATKAKAPTTKKAVKKTKPAKPAKKQAPAKKAGPAAAKKSGKRQKYLGTHEKNIISIGIANLPDPIIKEILAMIKSETDVDEGDDGEVELDIDVVSPESLWKIYDYVVKYSPESVTDAKAMLDDADDEPPAKSAKPPAKKKNKPMSKSEQERKIEQLDGTLQTFQRHASGSQEPLPTVEPQDQSTPADESSGDESDSEED